MKTNDPFLAAWNEWIEIFMRRSMRNFLLYSKESGLSMSQIGALFRLHRGASGVSDLGDGLGVTSAAASQLLERLVHSGLILRSEDPNDRRGKQIVLTDKGRRVLRESLHARQGWLDDLAAVLSNGEKEKIAAALKILIEKTNLIEPPAQ
jgi:DNA-binding MarR family transcriptional regulator